MTRRLLAVIAVCFSAACSQPLASPGLDTGSTVADVATDIGLIGADCAGDTCDASAPCSSDLHCKASGQVCDVQSGDCVDCLTSVDCDGGELCVQAKCKVVAQCKTSKECPKVCDTTAGICVDCLADTDCNDGLTCVKQTCAKVCTASKCEAGQFFGCDQNNTDFLAPVSCDDGIACTIDACEPLLGCTHTKTAACNSCNSKLTGSPNVGCEFWSVDLDVTADTFAAASTKGPTPDKLPHSVVLANPGTVDATVSVYLAGRCGDGTQCIAGAVCAAGTCGDTPSAPYELAKLTVVAGKTAVLALPVLNVDGVSKTRSAVQIVASEPISVWQFNVWDGKTSGGASGDGAFLLPSHQLGNTYYAITSASADLVDFPGMPLLSQQAYVTIVATSPGNTQVTVQATAKIEANAKADIPAWSPGNSHTLTLQQFEVLNLPATNTISLVPNLGLTGTLVEADKPIAVFVGHEEAVVYNTNELNPELETSCCADHIEEQLAPVSAWGMSFVCPKTKPRDSEVDVWVVVAGEDNVQLTTSPFVNGLHDETIAKAGQWREVKTNQTFALQATGKIQVAQFTVGGSGAGDIGDPTMMLTQAIAAWEPGYLLHVPPNYLQAWVTVVQPKGTTVTLDGEAVAVPAVAVGDSNWERIWLAVSAGPHVLKAAKPIGVWVYGYDKFSAFGVTGSSLPYPP